MHWQWVLPLLLLMATAASGHALTRHGPASFDAPLILWFRLSTDTATLAGPAWALAFWQALTWLGDTLPRIVVGIGTVIGLLWLRRWQGALLLAGVMLSGLALSTTCKQWVGRPRPQLVTPLDHVTSLSFPSGHALNSTLFYMAVAVMLAPLLRARAMRWAVYAVAIGLSLATGVSRVALGVHYPTDVIAGWVIAGAWVWLWFTLARRYWPRALR
ncbi:MAG: phosphatase PAP2 family protein [Burkholderiales bacterium]|nr:phosphatase PAP2 family protein [Burkholderiales bacterium]